jgi:chemotaxis protein MotA
MEQIEDDFLKKGLQLVVDGTDPEIIKTVLYNDVTQLNARHGEAMNFFGDWADKAPAFGMIGTLIGLVQMLSTLEEPARIGPAMALAILTTLYGSLIAYLVCLPLAEKLKNRSREEVAARMLVLEGILAIVEGDHPTSVQQKLTAHVAPALRRGPERRPGTEAA